MFSQGLEFVGKDNPNECDCLLTPDLLHLGRLADLKKKNRRIDVEKLEEVIPDGSYHIVSKLMIHNNVEYRLWILVHTGDNKNPSDLFLDVDFEDYDQHKSVIHFNDNKVPIYMVRRGITYPLTVEDKDRVIN